MSHDGSVTHWIRLLPGGDHQGAQPLWERYFSRLEALARTRLRGQSLAIGDAEDVALSAFHSLCRGLQRGHFPQLTDRDNLWRLLVVITARKASHLLRDEQCGKRGGTRSEAQRIAHDSAVLEATIGQEPTPEFSAQMCEELDRLLQGLKPHHLDQIALWKLEGYTHAEIAQRLGCAPRTIDRKMRLIRRLWEKESDL